jgi:YD repeat-containing protein
MSGQLYPAHLQYVNDAAGTRVAAMDYDGSGRLKRTCDAEGACSRTDYDLLARTVVQSDATARATKYAYDARGNGPLCGYDTPSGSQIAIAVKAPETTC